MIFVLLGMLTMLGLIFALPAKNIASLSDLESLQANQKVILKGKIVQEREFDGAKMLILQNNITIICPFCKGSLLDKSIEGNGKVEEYRREKRIKLTSYLLKE